MNFQYLLPDITFGKALHVILYKNETMARKIVLISRNITIMIWLYTLFESVRPQLSKVFEKFDFENFILYLSPG